MDFLTLTSSDLKWPQLDLNLTSCDHSTSNVHKKLLKLSLTEKLKKWWLRHKSLEWWLRSPKLKRAVPDDVLDHLQKEFWKYQLLIRLQEFHKIRIFWNFDGHSWTLEFIFFPNFRGFVGFQWCWFHFWKETTTKSLFSWFRHFVKFIFFPPILILSLFCRKQELFLFSI